MGCCSPKECAGKWGIIFFATAFTCGVIASVAGAGWISTSYKLDDGSGSITQQQLGPFYSQVRVCDNSDPPVCPDWTSVEISMDDCNLIPKEDGNTSKFCNNLNTWRVCTILCSIITFITACLVLAGFLCTCVTCGCCGGSFDQIAVLGYWIEVLVSIIAWSFAISVMYILRGFEGVDSNLSWGFWLFVASGTIFGGICATLADWAAESSILKRLCCCLKD